MTHSIKRALALLLALLLAIPAFAFAEPLDDELEIAYEEAFEVDSDVEEAADEVTLDLSELDQEEETLDLEEEVAVEDEASDEAALIVADPAFVQSETIDGVTITVKAAEGVFPADATLSVEKVEMDVAGEVDGEVAAAYTYDIKVLDAEGNEQYQPDDDELIEINFNMAEVANDDYQTVVFHITDDEETVEELVVYEDGQNALVYTDGFSFYQVVFVYIDSAGTAKPVTMDSATYTIPAATDGVLLTDVLKSVMVAGGTDLDTDNVLEKVFGGQLISTATLELSTEAQKYLDKKACTSPTAIEGVSSYDFLITWKQDYPFHDPLDTDNVYLTVTQTTANATQSATIYLKKSTSADVNVKIGSEYYATLEDAVEEVADGDTIAILNDLTAGATDTVDLVDGDYTLNLNAKTLTMTNPLRVMKANAETSLTVEAAKGGNLKGNLVVKDGAALTIEDADVTINGALTVDGGVATISKGTFNGAVTITNSTGEADAIIILDGSEAKFEGAVSLPDGSIAGGYFKNKVDPETMLAAGYIQVNTGSYWKVVEDIEKLITYQVVEMSDANPTTFATVDFQTNKGTADTTTAIEGVTYPTEKQYYHVNDSVKTTLWTAGETFADYGVFDGWYNYADTDLTSGSAWKKAVYDKREDGKAPKKVTEIAAGSEQDEDSLKFVGLVTPYVAEVDGVKYTTLAEAGAKAVEKNATMKLLRPIVTGSEDTYELPVGKTLKVEVTSAMETAMGVGFSDHEKQIEYLTETYSYITVDPGNKLDVAYVQSDKFATFTVAGKVASVTKGGKTEYYGSFYVDKPTEEIKKLNALNMALDSTGNTLSVPAQTPKPELKYNPVINPDGTDSWTMDIVGFDNIDITNLGWLVVGKNTVLTIDSENFTNKVKGTDDTSKLTVKIGTGADAKITNYEWDNANSRWIQKDNGAIAVLYEAGNKTAKKGEYATLKRAVAAAEAGDLIVLMDDSTEKVDKAKGEDGIVTISKNLTIEPTASEKITSDALNTIVVDGATLTLKGVAVENTYATADAKASTILVKSGTLVLNNTAVINPTNVTTATSQTAITLASASAELKVEGDAVLEDQNTTVVTGLISFGSGKATITDGIFTDTTNVPGKISKEYAFDNDSGKVDHAEAYIASNNKGYKTVEDAFEAALGMTKEGQEIHLVKNAADAVAAVTVTKNVTLVMEGKSWENDSGITVNGGKTLTVKGTNVTFDAAASKLTTDFTLTDGKLVIDAGEYVGSITATKGDVDIKNAKFTTTGTTIAVGDTGTPSVTVTLGEGNEFEATTSILTDGGDLKTLNVTGGIYESTDVEFDVSDTFADTVNWRGQLQQSTAGGITGGEFKHNEFEKDSIATTLDELCQTGYAVTSKKDKTTERYAVKPAALLTFEASFPKTTVADDTKYELVDHKEPVFITKVVKGEKLGTKAPGEAAYYMDATSSESDTRTKAWTFDTDTIKKVFAFQGWYNKADSAKTVIDLDTYKFEDTMTLVADYAKPVARVTPLASPTPTYYTTLKEAFNAWREYTVDPEDDAVTYSNKPTAELVYTYGDKDFTFAKDVDGLNLANIDADKITAIVDEVVKGLGEDGNVAMSYTVTPQSAADTFLVAPIAVAYVGADLAGASKTVTGKAIGNDSLMEKAEITVSHKDLKPEDAVGASQSNVVVVISSDLAGKTILQTVNDAETDENTLLTVNNVNKFGYFAAKAADRAVASVTVGDTTTYYPTFKKAVEAAAKVEDGSAVVKLVAATVDSGNATIEGGTFTVDLNGNTLNTTTGSVLNIKNGEKENDYGKTVEVVSNIEIVDSSVAKTGTIVGLPNYIVIDIMDKSNLTVSGGTISGATAISHKGTGTVTINKGATVYANEEKPAVTLKSEGTLVVNGGYVGCVEDTDAKSAKIDDSFASETYAIDAGDDSTVTINGGFVMGNTAAIYATAYANVTIVDGYIGGGANFAGSNFKGAVMGGCFTDAVTELQCAEGSFPGENKDEYTSVLFPNTVIGTAVAKYTTGSGANTVYVETVDEAVLAKVFAGDKTLTLMKDVDVVTPLVVKQNGLTIDLNGHTLGVEKITKEQYDKLTAAQLKAKGLNETGIEGCKYGVTVVKGNTLTITDTTVTAAQTEIGKGAVKGGTNLEAAIYVAGTLNLKSGNVTKEGSGNAIYDAGTVVVGETDKTTAGEITAASDVAINVVDGVLTVNATKGEIKGANAVKFAQTATSKTGKVTINAGKLTGTKGAALVVDNTGNKIVSVTTRNELNHADVKGGSFTAPDGVQPIQTLTRSGAAATATTAVADAFVGQFVEGGEFSAPITDAALVYEYVKGNADGKKMCSTVLLTGETAYTIKTPVHVTLDANGGAFAKGNTVVVDIPTGQLLATGDGYEEPTYALNKFLGWSPIKGSTAPTDYTKANTAAGTDETGVTGPLYAVWDVAKYTVTLNMNGGAFTQSTAYDSTLNIKGIKRGAYNASTGTLVITDVPETTTLAELLPTSGANAELKGADASTTFNSWRDASDAEVTAITADVTLTAKYNYQITFVNDDDSVLQSTMMVYGSTPSRAEPTSTKTDHTYIFKAWDPAIQPVTKAQTYKATYDIAVATVDGKDYASAEDAVAAAKAAKEAGKDDTITLLEDTTIELKEGEAVKVKPADKATVTAPADQALKTTENEDGTVSYEAVEPVAKVGDTLCATMDDASKAAAEAKAAGKDDTIELLADVEDPYTLKDGEILNVKADGKKLTVKDAEGNEVEGVTDESTGITTYTATVTVTFDTDGGNEIEAQKIASGAKATKPADPTKEGYIFVKWVDAEGAEFDFDKPVTKDTTVKAIWTTYIHITSRNALLEGAISVQIKVDPLDATILADKDAVVRFSFKTYTEESKEVKLSEFKTDNNGKYVYGAEVVLAHFADDVTVTFVNGEGKNMATQLGKDRTDVTDGYTFSLKALCEANRGDDTPGDRLYEALFDYSTAAQIYFKQGDWQSLKVDEHVTSVTIDDFKDVPATETTPAADRPEGVKGSYNVTCEGDHTMNVTFTLPAGKTPADYTFTLDGNTVTPVEVSGKYRVEVANVAAEELNEVHTIAISDGAKTFSVKASLLSYFKGKVEKGDEASANMGKAILRYNQAALEVLNAQKQ